MLSLWNKRFKGNERRCILLLAFKIFDRFFLSFVNKVLLVSSIIFVINYVQIAKRVIHWWKFIDSCSIFFQDRREKMNVTFCAGKVGYIRVGYWRFMNRLVRIRVTSHACGDITCKCRLGRGYDILMACRQVEAFAFLRTRSINPRDYLFFFFFSLSFFSSFSPAERTTGIPVTSLKGDFAPRKPVPGPTNRSLLSNHRFR